MESRTTPKWPFDRTLRDGGELHRLAMSVRERLESRLPAGLIDGLGQDLESMLGNSSSAVGLRTAKKGARYTQDEAIEATRDLVHVCREAIKRLAGSTAELQKDFGVGIKVQTGVVRSAVTALDAVIKGFELHPEEARRAGLLSDELEEVKALRRELLGANTKQEVKAESSKTATKIRNATQVRVEVAMETLVGVALVVFRKEPAMAERFRKLLPTRVAKKKKVPVG